MDSDSFALKRSVPVSVQKLAFCKGFQHRLYWGKYVIIQDVKRNYILRMKNIDYE